MQFSESWSRLIRSTHFHNGALLSARTRFCFFSFLSSCVRRTATPPALFAPLASRAPLLLALFILFRLSTHNTYHFVLFNMQPMNNNAYPGMVMWLAVIFTLLARYLQLMSVL